MCQRDDLTQYGGQLHLASPVVRYLEGSAVGMYVAGHEQVGMHLDDGIVGIGIERGLRALRGQGSGGNQPVVAVDIIVETIYTVD